VDFLPDLLLFKGAITRSLRIGHRRIFQVADKNAIFALLESRPGIPTLYGRLEFSEAPSSNPITRRHRLPLLVPTLSAPGQHHTQHQFIDPAHEGGWIAELTTLGELGLIEQDHPQVGKTGLVPFGLQTLHQ